MILNLSDIQALEQRYRTAFVNSLAGFRQAVLVGTCSTGGATNLAIFNSLIHLGAAPALFGLISRPDTVPRDTLRNIRETGTYTLNYVPAALAARAHQTSARYSPKQSEFSEAGFTEQYHEGCAAPFVAEAVVQVALQLEQIIDIPLNGTVLIIGGVRQVRVPDALVGADGFVDLAAADVLMSCGLDAYFTAKPLARFPYALP
ncbi:flavin reductase family protein [Flaviaesturariibacter amylovorans]|uniref:Flavin reductase n=1 Tax=Flaviaesturariibacter amylovorans TaxID=1084520 RepID=A0ABP8G6Y9_9BACT